VQQKPQYVSDSWIVIMLLGASPLTIFQVDGIVIQP
jgi:hypothetical protein